MKSIIAKWYKKLGFPAEYDDGFYELLESTPLTPSDIDSYEIIDDEAHRGINLLMSLYFCEALSKKYEERGIPEEYLLDTMENMVFWSGVNYAHSGKVGLIEPNWLKILLSFKLFKLGRLHFCLSGAYMDIPAIGVKKNDPILEIHIPRGKSLTPETVDDALDKAREFFPRYFPEYEYKCFTCYSWMLDESLADILGESSNIVKFGNRFTRLEKQSSDAIIRFTVDWYANRENLDTFPVKSSLNASVKRVYDGGGTFFTTFGYIEK